MAPPDCQVPPQAKLNRKKQNLIEVEIPTRHGEEAWELASTPGERQGIPRCPNSPLGLAEAQT